MCGRNGPWRHLSGDKVVEELGNRVNDGDDSARYLGFPGPEVPPATLLSIVLVGRRVLWAILRGRGYMKHAGSSRTEVWVEQVIG